MSGLIEVKPTLENVIRHFKQTLTYVASRKELFNQQHQSHNTDLFSGGDDENGFQEESVDNGNMSSLTTAVPVLFGDVDIAGVMLKFNLEP